jgi:hypothetical protein
VNLSELLSDIAEAEARLRIATGYLRDAWRRLGEQEPSIPTRNGGTPPENTPERFVSWDEQQRDRRALEDAAKAAFLKATVVYDVATRWGQPLHERQSVDSPDEMWCKSCWRDDKHHEPVAIGRYKTWCRFCGDWKAAHKRLPPVEILEARHSGRRITSTMVEKALANQRKKRKKAS